MCGIFGNISSRKLKISNNVLSHRGPDDWGVYYNKFGSRYCTLFHSRLEIIGLGTQGHQPYQIENYNSVLIYNGEIYNYLDIKNKLINDYNENFVSNTDTEVLYKAIFHMGIDSTLEEINGMFSFAFLDERTDTLYLARDPLGIKPLYYFHDENTFTFSSEIKTIFELNILKPEINHDAIGEYFANGWVIEPDTMFNNIYKIKSGHLIYYDLKNNMKSEKRFWDIRDETNIEPNIEKIIRSQKVSDVPLGIYLSGGYDSSIISYALKNEDIINLNLDLKDSESRRVKMFETQYGLTVKKIKPNISSIEIYDKLLYHMDEPISDPAIIPAYELAKQAKELGMTVMLSGMGGDEIDAGYSRHRIILNINRFKFIKYLPNWIIRLMKGKIKRDIYRLKNFLMNPVPSNYFSLSGYLNGNEINDLLGVQWYIDYKKKVDSITESFSGIHKYFILDIVGFLSSHNLVYMDKASMAASVEVRVPLLDKNIVSRFFSDIDIVNKNSQKKRLKSILKNYLGKNYFPIKKEGFRYPINDYIKNHIDWNDVIDYMNKLKLFNVNPIEKWIILSKHNDNSSDMKLWNIYTFYRWHKIFF